MRGDLERKHDLSPNSASSEGVGGGEGALPCCNVPHHVASLLVTEAERRDSWPHGEMGVIQNDAQNNPAQEHGGQSCGKARRWQSCHHIFKKKCQSGCKLDSLCY